MIPTYTTPVVLPKICLAFDWPTQMKIPRTARGDARADPESLVGEELNAGRGSPPHRGMGRAP